MVMWVRCSTRDACFRNREHPTCRPMLMCACVQHCNSVDEIENLREIQALRRLNHNPNIIQLEEVIL